MATMYVTEKAGRKLGGFSYGVQPNRKKLEPGEAFEPSRRDEKILLVGGFATYEKPKALSAAPKMSQAQAALTPKPAAAPAVKPAPAPAPAAAASTAVGAVGTADFAIPTIGAPTDRTAAVAAGEPAQKGRDGKADKPKS